MDGIRWASKTSKKRKCVIRRWRLDRFGDDKVKLSYQNALMAEVHEFSESTKSKIERHEGARIGK